ncbi:MAG: hypothetical protein ISS74_01605 [Planctomycetes bacterium]|nr:hypothetical protein [Planctomycetota bacterium]
MEEIGQLVSEFVEERVEDPLEGEEELWSTGVCVCLFSVAFQVLVHCRNVREGQKACEQAINAAVDSASRHAAKWIHRRMGRAVLGTEDNVPPIHIDLYPEVRHRLNLCFNEALRVLAERGYKLDTARSHVCFAVLSSAIEQMILRGRVKDGDLAAEFQRRYFEQAENLSREIRQLLERNANT